jgi:hypothetical protein
VCVCVCVRVTVPNVTGYSDVEEAHEARRCDDVMLN